MDGNGVRRSDTTRGLPLRVLSLDGGGVRGYSMLIIVQELMHRTFVEVEGRAPRRHEIPKPCDHFDLIVGTGTGGLIAIMLGRLRLDLETCKELYVRMTRMVFQTDKTIAGIPYRSTLFKASKLEDAIRQGVWEHTVFEKEGNDSEEPDIINPINAAQFSSAGPKRQTSNASTLSFSARNPTGPGQTPTSPYRQSFNSRYGNGEARLYDARENRCKTAVTAMYKGSGRGAPPVFLRSYDSRREPASEFECKIWQAGRATCAIGLAFKPIQIGQSMFHDDGSGTFNPAPEALDEAVINEWPGREIGVFVSVGTGKRPRGSDQNQNQWYDGFLGDFADARKKLIAKIEGCEKIHEYMMREHLAKRGVNIENYYRLNVEVGVGEFGMNEWNRLSDISTSTRRYMGREEEQHMIFGISNKLGKVYKMKQRMERASVTIPELVKSTSTNNYEYALAVELPGDTPALGTFTPSPQSPPSRTSFDSGIDSLPIQGGTGTSPRNSNERARAATGHSKAAPPYGRAVSPISLTSDDPDRFVENAPTPAQYRNGSGADKIAITSPDEEPRPRLPPQPPTRIDAPPLPPKTPPPLPPKTPLQEHGHGHGPKVSDASIPPYPLDDEQPPAVNFARKPDYRLQF